MLKRELWVGTKTHTQKGKKKKKRREGGGGIEIHEILCTVTSTQIPNHEITKTKRERET